jgi:hypothetical protein
MIAIGRYETLIRAKFGDLPETLTSTQLAIAMGITPNALKMWRKNGLPFIRINQRGNVLFKYQTGAVIEWATKYQPLPAPAAASRAVPPAEWGWRRDQKINSVTDKQ